MYYIPCSWRSVIEIVLDTRGKFQEKICFIRDKSTLGIIVIHAFRSVTKVYTVSVLVQFQFALKVFAIRFR